MLACGAELKSTFCLAKGPRAWVGHHIGDLRNAETLTAFREGIAHFERLFDVVPEVVAHDLHPDYLSTAYALEREGVELVAVQHHHAHLAACLAEHGLQGPAVGAIYDGTGLGPDGTAWGGEVLVGDLRSFRARGPPEPASGCRAATARRASRGGWHARGSSPPGASAAEVPATLRDAVPEDRWAAVARLAETGFAAPETTSMGRLFDAVAALCGLRAVTTYEGQAAIELEAVADDAETSAYALGARPRRAGRSSCAVARRRPRRGRAAPSSRRASTARSRTPPRPPAPPRRRTPALELVVLSGGVFQNRLLLTLTADELTALGLRVLVPERLPANDGGIAFGQAAVAAARG